MLTNDFHWLPDRSDWLQTLQSIDGTDAASWDALRGLANSRIDFLRTNRLDRVLLRLFGAEPPAHLATKPVRLAVLGASTVDHLMPGLRVGALRRGLHLTTYVGDYGQYFQELNDPASALYDFRPTAVLLSLDAASLLGAPNAAADADARRDTIDAAIERLRSLWRLALDACQGQVIQQTVLPLAPSLAGSNE